MALDLLAQFTLPHRPNMHHIFEGMSYTINLNRLKNIYIFDLQHFNLCLYATFLLSFQMLVARSCCSGTGDG